MNVLGILGLIFLMAFLVEAVVEAVFGKVAEHVAAIQPYDWLLAYIAYAIGIGGAFIYGFDLLHILGEFLQAPVPATWFGIALTGVGVGRGSNFINDIMAKFFKR